MSNAKCEIWEDVNDYLKKTYDPKPQVRKMALREFCPCHVRKDIDLIWARIFEMVTDPDAVVRDQVVHTLCDGSPKEREEDVVRCLESMWNDKDQKVRRRVRKALGSYYRTGKWNIF